MGTDNWFCGIDIQGTSMKQNHHYDKFLRHNKATYKNNNIGTSTIN